MIKELDCPLVLLSGIYDSCLSGRGRAKEKSGNDRRGLQRYFVHNSFQESEIKEQEMKSMETKCQT